MSELRSCAKAELDVLGSPARSSPCGLFGHKATLNMGIVRAQELCESRGGHPGFQVPNSPYGLCGCKATLNLNCATLAVILVSVLFVVVVVTV